MRLKVLGAYGASDAEHNLTGYLIDDWFAVDAGTLTSKLSFAQQARVQAVFISHPHADHLGGVGSVLRRFPVGLVIEPGGPFADPSYAAMLTRLDGDVSSTSRRRRRAVM